MLRLGGWTNFIDNGLLYVHPELVEGHEISIRIIDAASLGHYNIFLFKYFIYIDGHNAKNLDERRDTKNFYSNEAQ